MADSRRFVVALVLVWAVGYAHAQDKISVRREPGTPFQPCRPATVALITPQECAPTFDGHMAMPGSAAREAILNAQDHTQVQQVAPLSTTKPLGVDVSKWQGTVDWVSVK